MNAQEKEKLLAFLDTAYSYASGIPFGVCAGEAMCAFRDDASSVQNSAARSGAHSGIGNPQSAAAVRNAEPQNGGITIAQIAEKISHCTRCQLSRTRKNTVPGTGVLQPLVLVVGEGPGADEDASGEPFVGKAGKLLDKMLAAIRLDRHTNCFIANIVKCRPPGNRDPLPEEADACRSYIEAQIHVLKPKMILAVGRVAAQNLLRTTEPIGKLRGRLLDYGSIPFMATYHPSALLRNEALKRPAWEDLKQFKRCLDSLVGDSGTY
ncbi:MAG: uracil-DNA glycosylase [Bacteroides sp.]|nr:uracil-DNA glycosylase [Prevotella sp.]MCM1407297.1 uracil-DNA glycosylase [Treponema brennaborense]MCM1469785.1 uracil-DNA glycosylase [Bacteroides sp.]